MVRGLFAGWFATCLVFCVLLATPTASADDLGSARLLVAGTELTVSPESQTVPFNTPTVVETELVGYDTANGVLPDDLRVVADFTGPEIDGILVLETRPGQPFRIPRLSLKGEYVLDNIRLVQGDELLTYAQPRSAAILVTQVLVTRVTSRALTEDEIRSYGIVVDDDNFHAFSFTFGFAVDGEVYDYSVPVVQRSRGTEILSSLETLPGFYEAGRQGTSAPRFRPPQMAPFTLELEQEESAVVKSGGCGNPFGCGGQAADVRLPGVLLFPTDVSLLNQFFSVVLMAQNGAPEGDPLVIRDLTAKVTLPSGLRMAETEPPTPLGVPVPVRVPGADGRLGTADDVTFLVAQATGEAEVLVEGRKEGTHVVEFDLAGVLEGLPGGGLRRIAGSARGAVVVRDPTLGVTISHPSVVRVDEEYDLRLVVSNTSNAPVNQATVALPAAKLSGVEVVGPAEQSIPTLLPGESEIVEFRMRPLRTGRVTASSVRSPYQVDPRFELTVGVGELGIPLSPDAIVLPETVEELDAGLVRSSLALIGLGFSLATAPAAGFESTLPRMDLHAVDEKVYWLSQAGRHVRLGEEAFDALAVLAAEWTGARGEDWEWDRLRRSTDKGGKVGDSLAQAFAAEATATSDRAAFRRFAATTAFLGPLQGALAVGSGARAEVSSRTTGLAVAGDGVDPTRRRELPFADLYAWAGAQMALLARPEVGGHQVRLTDSDGGTSDLELLVTDTDGDLRAVRWDGLALAPGGLAVADFAADQATFTLFVDDDGDGLVDQQLAGTVENLSPRPFAAVAAVQKESIVSGHVIEVLFTRDVDLGELTPADPVRFQLPGNVSNGGLVKAEERLAALNWVIAENKLAGLRNTRVVQVAFSNPVSPYVEHDLEVRDVSATDGGYISQSSLPLVTNSSVVGGLVEGRVIGPDGKVVPLARVELIEADSQWGTFECLYHRTAAVVSDAEGRFRFDFVRNETCNDGVFRLRATDPQTGRSGESVGRVRFEAQVHELDVVMLGRGTVRGRVTYEDGTVPAELRVVAYSPVFTEGIEATVLADGSYEAREVPVGSVTLGASDRRGGIVYQTVEVPTAGAVVERDLTILRLSPQTATGDVRGTVYQVDGTTPAVAAYLALYVDGELVGVERSAADGGFDFGTVPAGLAEIEGFDGVTGLAGVFVQFDVLPDQVNEISLYLQDERGAVEGHVYRRTAQGTEPVAGAVVWVDGTPFNTVTDAEGAYRLDGVFAGTRQVYAADLERQEQTGAMVTITDGGTSFRDLHFVEDFGDGGITGEVLGFNGNPVPGAIVHLGNSSDQRWWHEAVADTLGRFSIPDLGPGTYIVNALSGDVGIRREVTVRYAGDTPFVSLRFKKGTIRGRTVALGEYGEPVPVTSLVTYTVTAVNEGLVGPSWTPVTIETEADGSFEIPDVLVGPYTLSVSNAFHGEQTVRGELVYHEEVVEHEISFQRNGSIGGVVVGLDGETPVEGAVVHLRHPDFADYELVTDAEGRFAFELLPPGGRFPIDVELDDGAIFRRSRVWVNFNRYGLDMEVEISLAEQGTVSGWVEDASGNPVPGAAVTLREHAHPRRSLHRTADESGFYSFTNVFRGLVTIDAQAPSLGGLGGRTSAQVTTEGEEVWTLIALEGAGEITGRVLSPVDGEPVASAQVTLYKWLGGVLDAVTADADGAFRFRLLPEGLYRVWAFDPSTGRHGAWDSISVDHDGHVVDGEVTLEVRGAVEGHLTDPDRATGVPGATVVLHTDSLVDFRTFSSSDADGYYEFLGIPEGHFRLHAREPFGRRQARAEGTISEEGERISVDLALEATGSVAGSVLAPPGAPAGLFANANTVVREGGYVVGATLDNPYTFEGLIVGRPFKLEAWEVGGEHRGTASGVVSTAGEVVAVDVTMRPIGAVTVVVADSFGAPVAGADLALKSSGFYGRRHISGSTGPDGSVTFQEIGEGRVSAYVVNPIDSLRGSGSGAVALDGEVVQLAVQLEDSARLTGRLLLADGTTPAEDTLVVIAVAGREYQLRADENGDFEFPSLPLGGFSLVAQEYFGPGSLETGGTLSTNGEVVDLGTLVLDAADPELVSHLPASGAHDLPLSTAVVLEFSEALDTGRFSTNWFRFKKLSGANVAYSVAWSGGGSVATLTPSSPLANFTVYEVIVQDAVDAAGRHLKEKVKLTFNTVDQVPPGVVDVLPRDGQVQVAVDTNLRIAFSEPVDLESLSGAALQLTDAATGTGVTTTFQLLAGERQVIVTPQPALATDTTYRLTIQGVADGSGNAMTVPVVTTFDTVDTLGPSIDAVTFPAGTSFESGEAVPMAVTASDPSGVGEVRVHFDEWSVFDDAEPWELSLLAPMRTTADTVTLTIEALDVYGNASTTTRTVDVGPHSNATAATVTALCGQDDHLVLPGVASELRLGAVDDEKVESIRLLVDGVEVDRAAPFDAAEAEAGFLWTPPAEAVAGDSWTVRLEARDFAGNVTGHDLAARVPDLTTTVFYDGTALLPEHAGQDVVLSGGTFAVRDPVDFASLTLLRGAALTNGTNGTFEVGTSGDLVMHCGSSVEPGYFSEPGGGHLVVDGRLVVESEARLDASENGYPGDGGAPSWVEGAGQQAGAGHGGAGIRFKGEVGGEVYGSVYRPRLGGAGGGYVAYHPGRPGGGILEVTAGELVLDGEIVSSSTPACSSAGGAGGSVLLEVGTLRGSGRISVDGGRGGKESCSSTEGAAGGGRVAIYADQIVGFDVASQVTAWGGTGQAYSYPTRYAPPGTVYVREGGTGYGSLRIDSGTLADGTVRQTDFPTELPVLAGGAVTAWEASSGDAWLTGDALFHPRWEGVWVVVLDAAGVELGGFEVIDRDGTDRLLLAGAGSVAGAVGYRGEYRFDRVEIVDGAGLKSTSKLRAGELESTSATSLEGDVEVGELLISEGDLTVTDVVRAEDLRLVAGAVLRPPTLQPLRLEVAGTVTLEAGAKLDATDRGYAAGTSSSKNGKAPAGVEPAPDGGGGSHGGSGIGAASTGETYGSFYLPSWAGGGGGYRYGTGRAGGGIIEVVAGELVLDGEIEASSTPSCSRAGGAGGSVLITVGTLRGSGSIDVDGIGTDGCNGDAAGGGGRVAILADVLDGFSPTAQVTAQGGFADDSSSDQFAGAGTVFWRTAADARGHLLVHQDATSLAVAASPLPGIGRGIVGAIEADAAESADLWIEPQDPATLFGLGVVDLWVRVDGVEYRVLDQSGSRRRLLLEGATGAVEVGDAYLGLHRLDSLTVSGKANLVSPDGVLVDGDLVVDPDAGFQVLDLWSPEVDVTAPVQGSTFFSGETVLMAATVNDYSSLTSVVFSLGSQSVTLTEAPWEATLPAPTVAAEETHAVTATATDAEGNVGTATVSIQVQPIVSSTSPSVAVACPSGPAPLIAGGGLELSFVADHADGVEKVELLVAGDPAVQAESYQPPYTFRVDAPAGAVEGDTVAFVGRATSFSGTTAEVTYPATVVAGQVVSGDGYLAAGDASLDGASVVVTDGTLTVEGAHAFRDLVVLDGATLTHPATEPGASDGLQVSVSRDVYVGCGGHVDADGRGWAGGMGWATEVAGASFFREAFSDGLAAWQQVDYSTYQGPANWYVHADGFLAQTTNVHDPNGSSMGSDLLWGDGASMADFRLSFRMSSGDDDSLGAVFRYQDADNFYRVHLNHSMSLRRLEKRVDGVFTTLAEDAFSIPRSTWHEMEVVADGPHLELWFNGAKVLAAEDSTFTTGTFGFYTHGSAGAYFDDVLLRAVAVADPPAAGSHGGRGGAFNGSSGIYGAMFDPAVAGEGGGSRLGGAGGGVIRLAAGGEMRLDGVVSAAADSGAGSRPFGAGGAIRLDAATVTGSGSVDASGAGDASSWPGGSGGRVAIYAGTLDPDLTSRVTAAGGASATAEATGAAGTVYLHGAGTAGHLVLDNLGRETTQITELQSVLPGVIESVGTDTLIDSTADFPGGLEGTELTVDERPGESWFVIGRTAAGDGLVLDASSTPWSGQAGETYRVLYRFDTVTVAGGARGVTRATVGVSGATTVDGISTWSPGHLPELRFTAPEDGEPVSAGAVVSFLAEVDDLFGVDAVRLRFGDHSVVDAEAPFAWDLTAPPVSSSTLVPAVLEAVDASGYPLRAEIALQVLTASDPSPPTATLGDQPADGYVVLPDQPLGLDFTVADAEALYAWRVRVDSVVIDEAVSVDAPSRSGTVTWAPPQDPAGASYLVEVEAEDYGGNVAVASRVFVTPVGPVLTGTQTLDGSYTGQDLVLGAGTFTATSLQAASLALLEGAVLTHPVGGALDLDVAGRLAVQQGASVDVRYLGYAGATSSTSAGVPAGVAPATDESGGHHGGVGMRWYTSDPTGGEVYGSVYRPHYAGGGGALDNDGYGNGGVGGGALTITAGTVLLDGGLYASALNNNDAQRAAGAGGTVRIEATSLSGSGQIDAIGGYSRSCSSSRQVGAGGGGRISLLIDDLSGFDVPAQTRAEGGAFYGCSWQRYRYAGAGTVYARSAGSTFGDLWIDNGIESDGAAKAPSVATPLPALGSGAVTAIEVAGADLWVTAASAFRPRWIGAWMVLADAGGTDLGTFEVVDVDPAGRALLAGAGGAAAAMSWQGEYRFDSVTLDHGAGLETTDPLQAELVNAVDGGWVIGPVSTTLLMIEDGGVDTLLGNEVVASDMTVRSGARVSAGSADGSLHLEVPGTLTVESGAELNVVGLGYPGETASSAAGVPVGIAPAVDESGGNHGGVGMRWYTSEATGGEVYDSVYRPVHSGGGGARDDDGSGDGFAGGGVVNLIAGHVVLDGSVLAHGTNSSDAGRSGGAGGTVRVEAESLSGQGRISVHGGYARSCSSSRQVGAGGGGRIALVVDDLSGFDVASQTDLMGGAFYGCSWQRYRYAGPGTAYVKTASSTYGDLLIDSNVHGDGEPRNSTIPTPLPQLGAGPVTAIETAGPDLWVSGPSPFQARWWGAWMGLENATGAELGSYQIVEIDADGRVRLDGASGDATAAAWRGEYRFDTVTLDNGAGLQTSDRLVADHVHALDGGWVTGPMELAHLEVEGGTVTTLFGNDLQSTDLTLRNGSTVSPYSADGVLRLHVPGTLTVESNSRLVATALGYAGATPSTAAEVPPGVAPATDESGGNHGGPGLRWYTGAATGGEVYDSIYDPHLAGGGGALDDDGSGDGGHGGGVIEIDAGSVVLDGRLDAMGSDSDDAGRAGGGGGTISIRANELSGAGLVYASGGTVRACSSSRYVGPGGGGRVAVHVTDLSGFDPDSQAWAYGGTRYSCSWSPLNHASPGTVYVHTAGSDHGDLRIDNGATSSGTPRSGSPPTPIPRIGSGTVGATEVDGDDPTDLWIEPADPAHTFSLGVTGAWLRVGGVDYRILDQSADLWKVLLAGAAGAVSVNDAFTGIYKFDTVKVRQGSTVEFLDTTEIGTIDTDSGSQVIMP